MLLLAIWFSSWSIGTPSDSLGLIEEVSLASAPRMGNVTGRDSVQFSLVRLRLERLWTLDCGSGVFGAGPACGMLIEGNAAGGKFGLYGTVFGLCLL